MLTCGDDPACYLIEMSDFERDPLPDIVRDNLQPLTEIVTWAREYLCNPHPQLGRKGPICPYVQMSLEKQLFFLTVYRGREIAPERVYELVMRFRDWFFALDPCTGTEAHFKTILILFPDISVDEASQIIDATQAALKPEYVERGIMIGEFHPGPPQKSGLWNPDFLPLYSPIPLLAIRHMVPTDFPFLKEDKQFTSSYLKLFGEHIPQHLRTLVRKVADRFELDIPEGEIERAHRA